MSNIRSGAQFKAARALLGITQAEVAAASGLHTNSIRYLESQESVTTGHSSALVEEAMNKLGVVFFIAPTIGVRLKGHNELGCKLVLLSLRDKTVR
jgi:transcriptional regulator with XRE-family HTH domain